MVDKDFGSLTAEEVTGFQKQYFILVETLDSHFRMQNFPCTQWIKKVLDYNVPHGKQLRGLFVPMTVKYFDNKPTKEAMEQAFVLGWCIEMFQAFCLVADDIMDESETRRGKPCWYRVGDIGVVAFNDSLLIEHTLYRILGQYFGNHPRYADFLDIFLEVSYKTVLGQCLDTETERNRINREFYSMERYKKIAYFKTSFYTIYLPMALAVTLVGINDKEFFRKVEEVSKDIGYLFQIQDDYLDSYGKESMTGKIGTDIKNGKCSWLYVTALELASPKQLSALQINYGIPDPDNVAAIKTVYNDLDMPNIYSRCVVALQNEIAKKLEVIGCGPIQEAVFFMLKVFCDREK